MKSNRPLSNLQVAKLLRSVAAAFDMSPGDNRFKKIAYERAADAIEHSSSEVKDLWDEGELKSLSGIGDSIAKHLDELFKTGQVKHFKQLLKPFPPAVFELLEVPGIGPKNALKLCKSLGIGKAHSAVSSLEKAAKKGRIRDLEGFGVDSEAKIIQNIHELKGRTTRLLLNQAESIVDSIKDWIMKIPAVETVEALGSFRRQASTIGDIDFAVATKSPAQVIAHFCAYPRQNRVLEAGEKTASIIIPGDIQVDILVQSPDRFGSTLQHFTGSKHHNIALRELALKQGLSLSENGIKDTNSFQVYSFASETDFYQHLGLDWIPPELREGRGEIEAAKNHSLPKLVATSDIKGDLHMHCDFDIQTSHDLGQDSPASLLETAAELGYEYIGISDHNPSVSNHSLSQLTDLLKRRREYIHKIASPVQVYIGMEIDILASGKLALPDAALDLLDYAAVSIHSSFRQSRSQATQRVISALSHPKVKFLAHPTGRLLNEREGADLDWDTIFGFCRDNHKWLEVNSWPNRLDLSDVLVKEAVQSGVKLIINTDSHSKDQLKFIKYGVSVARRGWAASADIINTCSRSQMQKLLNIL